MVEGDDSENTTQEEEEYRRKWKDIISREEIFWKQSLRVLWLTEGDRNTSFHRSTPTQIKRNTILTLVDGNNNQLKGQDEIMR